MRSRLLLTCLAGLLSACGSDLEPIIGCDPVGEIVPVCGMRSPEDIAALDNGRHLLLAHFGGMEGNPGSISLFDTETSELTPLYPGPSAKDAAPDWGDATCTEPPGESLGPHGTHLHQLADGRWRYLVVNHNEREAVELFEVSTGPGDPAYQLTWRGCVLPPGDTLMNDAVGLANGDVIYTRMFPKSDSLAMVKSLFGMDTGEVWRWNPSTGATALPGTEAAQPNGIEISPDERYVYVNMYMEREVWKVDVDSGEVVGRGDVASADNSAWGSDGRLWIATHGGGLGEIVSCFEDQAAPCGAEFTIMALDPQTMAAEAAFTHRGPPMGAATIAVPQAGRVYMGSFAGDRMISVPLSAFNGGG
jgi:hypothetical protein